MFENGCFLRRQKRFKCEKALRQSIASIAAANAAAYNDSNGDLDNQLLGSKNDGTLLVGDENGLDFCC